MAWKEGLRRSISYMTPRNLDAPIDGRTYAMSYAFDDLAWDERWIRNYFRAVETLIDQALLQYALVETAAAYRASAQDYPFVNQSECKPGGVGPVQEHPMHNACLLMLYEHTLPDETKSNFRARKGNRVLTGNLRQYLLDLPESYDRISALRELEDLDGLKILSPMLGLDFGVLVERTVGKRKKGIAYEATHFHVKVDEVLDRVVESFGLDLRYLSKNLFEQGEDYAALLESKLYECYGMKQTASGRRTAGIIAHRLLSTLPGRSIVYAGSEEARSLFKWTDKATNRYLLVPFAAKDIDTLKESTGLAFKSIEEYFLYPAIGKDCEAVGLFQVSYTRTLQGLPPSDRQPRKEINPAQRWISVSREQILPKPGVSWARPIPYAWIYRSGAVDLVEPIVVDDGRRGK